MTATTHQLHVVARGYELVEAPMPDGSGGLYFTDARTGVIYHRGAEGPTTELGSDRIAGGMVRHRRGSLVLSGPTIAERATTGDWRVLFEVPARHAVETTFNDITALPDGSIVGGTLKWPWRPLGQRSADDLYADDAEDGEIWRVGPDGDARVVYGPVGISNGVEVAPGGSSVFFADTKHRRVLHLGITDGTFDLLGEISTAEVGKPDGLAVDAGSHVWVAVMDGGVVARFRPDGELVEVVHLPARKVTSLCFMGTNRADLIIGTGTVAGLDDEGGTIFRLDAGVNGAPVYDATI
jgi:sugar lactone lactonase YvrE